MSHHQSALSNVLLQPTLLAALLGKYEMLRDLRLRQVGDTAPRAELTALATAFPGALRELDRVPMEEIERRLGALRAVVEGRTAADRWMVLQIAYHGFMRAALRLRRLLLAWEREQQAVSGAPRLAYCAAPDEPALEHFDEHALAMIRNPPGGRLNPWVLEQVAREQGVSVACIENALWASMGPSVAK